MRQELLTAITQSMNTLTQFGVSQELPWSQNGQSLFRKNMKKIYIDNASQEQTTLFPVLSGSDVYQTLNKVLVYVAVDAKNPPTQTTSMVSKVLQARDTAVIVASDKEADYTVENDEDVTIYTFEFRFGVTL